ncbi:MAG: adenosylcobyric acid synthase [Tissierellia bacterium]|nr:adenosylcobyric acid synthase [Tissierellia bacterium]
MIVNICHLYGNLLNTYGDAGNIMALSHELRKKGHRVNVEIVSLKDKFDKDKYDFVFLGGGQDYEQRIVQKDLLDKKDKLKSFIEDEGLMLAICGGYQLLGEYYYDAYDRKIQGAGIFDHYTENQDNKNRFIGNIKIRSLADESQIYEGFENHGGVTHLGKDQNAFGLVIEGSGNNGLDKSEGFRYKNTIGTYLHGPLLARNENLCESMINIIYKRRGI